jgi:site-specific DNA-methyltransferase (cytosine-N4-specific)
VTGFVAESLGRKWVCCELEKDYLKGAVARFRDKITAESQTRNVVYSISPPCNVPISDKSVPLVKHGGMRR